MEENYDVLIAGGGVAGLTCARHISLQIPHLKIGLVERQARPLPKAAHKVGESSLAPQGNYLANTLKLRDYMESQHVEKFGVRYFFSDTGQKFSERPELGGSEYLGIREYQFDRGKLETDLREMNITDGVDLLEGYGVRSVDTNEDGHTLVCKSAGDGEDITLRSRWLIDATGRRRLIHGSKDVQRGECSAAWWRVEGWIDVEDFVGEGEQQWQSRVSSDHPRADRFGRVNSTTHLCGPGYWVWLIPLPDNTMSIGIVATEKLIPFEDYNSYPKALKWLEQREPELFAKLDELEILDFKFLRNYSYPAKEVLPSGRIGVIGEAVGFSDPFYSPGGDAIAIANSLIVEAIQRDEEGKLTDSTRAKVNDFFSTFINGYTAAIHSIYPCLGSSRLAACHVIWDFCSLVWLSGKLLNERDLIEQIDNSDLKDFLDEFLTLTRSVDQTCLDYWERSSSNAAAAVPSLAPSKLVNHHNAFGSLMRNADRLLKPPSEILSNRVNRLLGKKQEASWNRTRYLQTLRLVADGMKAYLAEQAVLENSTSPSNTAIEAGKRVDHVADYLQWTVANLRPQPQRQRKAAQIAKRWWEDSLQETA